MIFLWGSNAREAHPIFFHHVLKAVRRGAKLFVMDPRDTPSAQWADEWLPLEVGTDVALANGMAHAIIQAGLAHREFIANATSGYEAFSAHVRDLFSPTQAAAICGVPADVITRVATTFASAKRAMICWTLGITEHHNAVDNVLALINLALLAGHVGKWGSGLNPLRGQNNVQGGGDMGALPHKLTGFQDVEDPVARAKFEALWGTTIPPKAGWHLTDMFAAMERRDLRAVYVIGENPARSEADQHRAEALLRGLDTLIVQDIFLTPTAALADVVLPATASFAESEGTVTNSERRVQRVRRVVKPPAGARDDIAILADMARRVGKDIGEPTAETLWNELRTVSPMHAGMSYARLETEDGLQWPCPNENHPGSPFLHERLWQWPLQGRPAPFSVVAHTPPAEALTPDYPLRLTTGRHLDAYNTGAQSGHLRSPLFRGETCDLSPADALAIGVHDGEAVRVASRRGAVIAPARIVPGQAKGLVFMTFHYPDLVQTNLLTIDATDPRSGTAEFKAAAVRVERA